MIKLEVLDAIKGIIKAPDFCPYKKPFWVFDEFVCNADGHTSGERGHLEDGVHCSICKLCKICQFEPESIETTQNDVFTPEINEKVVNTLQNHQGFLESVTKQIMYLRSQDRLPLLILINFTLLQEVVSNSIDNEQYNMVLSHYTAMTCPICKIAGIDVVFSRKLTQSMTMVCGEIEWK